MTVPDIIEIFAHPDAALAFDHDAPIDLDPEQWQFIPATSRSAWQPPTELYRLITGEALQRRRPSLVKR